MTIRFSFPQPGKVTYGIIGLVLVLWLIPLNVFYNLEPGRVAISRDYATGRIELQDRHGWHLKPPWVLVSMIPTTPQRLCLTSAAHAGFNCKLVRFVPAQFREFLRVEGFGLYWWANRFSINTGYREEYRGIRDILRGYAFAAEPYQFIETVEEYER